MYKPAKFAKIVRLDYSNYRCNSQSSVTTKQLLV